MSTPDTGRPPIELPNKADRLVDQGVTTYFGTRGEWGYTEEPPTPTKTGGSREAVQPRRSAGGNLYPDGRTSTEEIAQETRRNAPKDINYGEIAHQGRKKVQEALGWRGVNATEAAGPSSLIDNERSNPGAGGRYAEVLRQLEEKQKQQLTAGQKHTVPPVNREPSHERVAAYRAKLAAQAEQPTAGQNE